MEKLFPSLAITSTDMFPPSSYYIGPRNLNGMPHSSPCPVGVLTVRRVAPSAGQPVHVYTSIDRALLLFLFHDATWV